MRFNSNFPQKIRRRDNPEARLVLQILKYLRYLPAWAGKVKVKGGFLKGMPIIKDRYLMKGLPDIFAFRNSIMYAIEAKIRPNKPTPEQEIFRGAFHFPPSRIYIVAYSLDDVIKEVK